MIVPDWVRDYRKEWLSAGCHRRSDGFGHRDSEGHGLRDHRGLARAGGPLHGVSADGDLRRARDLARPLSVSHDHHACHSGSGGAGRGGPGRRPGGPHGRFGHADAACRRHSPCWPGCCAWGFVANFISEPVLVGFKAGIGFGHRVRPDSEAVGHPYRQGVRSSTTSWPSCRTSPTHPSPRSGGGGRSWCWALLALEHYVRAFPGAADRGGRRNRRHVASRPAGLRCGGSRPGFRRRAAAADSCRTSKLLELLWPPALGIALMSFTETIAAGRAFAASSEPGAAGESRTPRDGPRQRGRRVPRCDAGRRRHHADRGEPAGRGARSQLAEIVTALATLATMLFLAPLIGLMPQATLAAIVSVYSIGLIKPSEFRAIFVVRRTEFVWAFGCAGRRRAAGDICRAISWPSSSRSWPLPTRRPTPPGPQAGAQTGNKRFPARQRGASGR